jgi:hypothetical protein
MTLVNSTPLKWTPRGASDTLDASNTFTGAMQALSNLIRDPTTLGIWVCRPASDEETDFTGFNAAGFVSTYTVVGNQVYGLVASNANPGKDEPFCYDFDLAAFIPVTGVVGANVPDQPATSGAWHPPTMALVGVKLVVTHPGFPGGAGIYFGWFDVSDPAAPTWGAGNTVANPLPFAPRAVFQFSNRAYFASGKFLVFSDVLDPLTVTNATQALTLGDNRPITALGGLPANTLIGAILQSLVVFKSESNPMQLYQVTGDAAAVGGSTLQINNMNVATGTGAPLSICATPKGLSFLAPDGLRFIDFQMNVSDPVNTDGTGVALPFIYAVEPSRICAACNGNILRISTQNNAAVGSPFQEWWLDFKWMQWSGPHTFPASLIKPYGSKFILAPQGVLHKLFTSAVQQEVGSVFIENDVQMTFNWQSPMLPDKEQMSECAMVETTLDIAYPIGVAPFLAVAGDQDGVLYDSVSLAASGAATIWGAFTWGQALWLGAANALSPRQIPWHIPIVFRRLYIGLSGDCSLQTKIGTLRMRYEQLGYLQQALTG